MRYRQEGRREAHNVLDAIKQNTELLGRIKVCLQGMLQLQQKHLRTKFRHLSTEQKSASALFLTLQSHMVETKRCFLPTISALQTPSSVSVQKRQSSGSRWRGVEILCSLTLEVVGQLRGRKHLLRWGGDEVLEIRESYGYCLLGKTKVDLNNVRALPTGIDEDNRERTGLLLSVLFVQPVCSACWFNLLVQPVCSSNVTCAWWCCRHVCNGAT
jgi:hypothetical protein